MPTTLKSFKNSFDFSKHVYEESAKLEIRVENWQPSCLVYSNLWFEWSITGILQKVFWDIGYSYGRDDLKKFNIILYSPWGGVVELGGGGSVPSPPPDSRRCTSASSDACGKEEAIHVNEGIMLVESTIIQFDSIVNFQEAWLLNWILNYTKMLFNWWLTFEWITLYVEE